MEALLRVTASPNSQPTDPLFRYPNGKLVLKSRFIKWLKRQLSILHHDPSLYAGHSLRIGAAASAARRGMSETVIQKLGRWKSDAYLIYIKYLPASIHHLRELIAQMGAIH